MKRKTDLRVTKTDANHLLQANFLCTLTRSRLKWLNILKIFFTLHSVVNKLVMDSQHSYEASGIIMAPIHNEMFVKVD